MHVRVQSQNDEAKFWLEPTRALTQTVGFSKHEINEAFRLVQEYQNDVSSAWLQHFPG